jgi:hypothetical protein
MKHLGTVWLAALLGVAATCGPNMARVEYAREATYNTDYAAVWNVVAAEMHARFDTLIKQEDASAGLIETRWKKVEAERDAVSVGTDPTRGGGAMFFRMEVRVVGGPPWRVVVDGEAARYQPNLSMLTPYRHGAVDEPQWVQGRIDAFRVAVYKRLREFAPPEPGSSAPLITPPNSASMGLDSTAPPVPAPVPAPAPPGPAPGPHR